MTKELIAQMAYELTIERAKKFDVGINQQVKPSNTEINDIIDTYNFFYTNLLKRQKEFHSFSDKS